MGDRVAVGWRHGTRWIVIGVYRPKIGIYTYDIQVDRRSKGAFQS